MREGNDVNWKESKEIIRHFRWMFLALALARGCVTTNVSRISNVLNRPAEREGAAGR